MSPSSEPSAAKRQDFEPRVEGLLAGMDEGTKMAVQMMRAGNLRLAPLPFERGQRPYDQRLRPIKATVLIWKSWLREVLNRG